MQISEAWEQALPYHDFLNRWGTPVQCQRWNQVLEETRLAPEQVALLQSFRRVMRVFCLAGTWCGDCVEQCPILQRFAEQTTTIDLRFFDRDADPDIKQALAVCGGARVPLVVILSEDGQEVTRFGDRTLTKYRQLASNLAAQGGASCATGLLTPAADFHRAVVQEWLDIFERAQLLLRLSPRLREKHGD